MIFTAYLRLSFWMRRKCQLDYMDTSNNIRLHTRTDWEFSYNYKKTCSIALVVTTKAIIFPAMLR